MREPLAECFPVDQLTGNVVTPIIFADLINGKDIGMIEGDHGARLLLEAPHPICIPGKVCRQKFKGSLTTRDDVSGQVDFAHSTGADPFRQLVVTYS